MRLVIKKSISIIILFLIIGTSGCATASKDAGPQESAIKAKDVQPPSGESQNFSEDEIIEIEKGWVFGKTDFQGVLKASFVELKINDVNIESNEHTLIIGDKSRQSNFIFSTQTVKPGYFLIELPIGDYDITTVSIPVGSTKATEDISLKFSVINDVVNYIGTLNLIGTKEKVKLGGVPVIKPGFEYTVDIIDEYEEALTEFQTQFSDIEQDLKIHILQYEPISESP